MVQKVGWIGIMGLGGLVVYSLPLRSIKTSVKKMVMAIGKATAVMLEVRPRAMKPQPDSFISLLKVARRPSSVLNIL